MGLFSRKTKVDDDHHELIVGEGIDQGIEAAGFVGDGVVWTEVVGESFYQEHLELIANGRTPNGTVTQECLAMIAFEPRNQYDKKAIAVKIAGFIVGYIGKDQQSWVASKIRAVKALDGQGAFVRARLIGGWDKGSGDVGMIGVALDLGED